MFTGIIQAIGTIDDIQQQDSSCVLTINTPSGFLDNAKLGDSICVQGVCLTVTQLNGNMFVTDVSAETIRCTTFINLKIKQNVNLEKALTLSDHLGGHLVSGHVDGKGEIMSIAKESNSTQYTIQAPDEISKYIAKKGSICIDGISLTVNDVDENNFTVNIIPHTFENTAIIDYQVNTLVNLEIDLVARYVERLHTY